MNYITNDPLSNYQLEKGVMYFMDFKTTEQPAPAWYSPAGLWGAATAPAVAVYNWWNTPLEKVTKEEQIRNQFIADMRERGHEVDKVSVESPEPDMIRIRFRASSPPVLLVVGLALAIVAIGVGIGWMFVGIGEMPGKTIGPVFETIAANPIPVIAIMAAFAIFFLGRKL